MKRLLAALKVTFILIAICGIILSAIEALVHLGFYWFHTGILTVLPVAIGFVVSMYFLVYFTMDDEEIK